MKFQDLTGIRYGRLVQIERAENKGKRTAWKCKCDCGNIVEVLSINLKRKYTQSCGCLHRETTIRNSRKPLEYRIEGDVAICLATNGVEFYVDVEDIFKIESHAWYQNDMGYILGDIPNGEKGVRLHRFLLGVDGKECVIDHIDRNPLNNRKSNLRICTQQQNVWNSGMRKNNTSGVTGVSYEKRRGRWLAKIKVSGKSIHIGYYKNFDDAVSARYKAEEKYFGDYCSHNNIRNGSIKYDCQVGY